MTRASLVGVNWTGQHHVALKAGDVTTCCPWTLTSSPWSFLAQVRSGQTPAQVSLSSDGQCGQPAAILLFPIRRSYLDSKVTSVTGDTWRCGGPGSWPQAVGCLSHSSMQQAPLRDGTYPPRSRRLRGSCHHNLATVGPLWSGPRVTVHIAGQVTPSSGDRAVRQEPRPQRWLWSGEGRVS